MPSPIPWGFTSPGAAHAMMFRRHMGMYGTTTRQLAEVSVAVRHHASLDPDAVMRNPFSIDGHENARFITARLRLLDYGLINDGAVCLILTSRERARDFANGRCWSPALAADRSNTSMRTSPLRPA